MNKIEDSIKQIILDLGPISFARFMEVALYTEGVGYYEHAVVGAKGDFQTSVSATPLFGELLAFQVAHWLRSISDDRPLSIMEAGAHDGTLAADLLKGLRIWDHELADAIKYTIVEPSSRRQEQQRQTLAAWQSQVRWIQSWDEAVIPLSGVVLSNELLDAFPFHRFAWNQKNRSWDEIGVNWESGRFCEVPLATNSVHFDPALPSALLDVLPKGFTVEFSPQVVRWWQRAARALDLGWLCTFDYGLSTPEFFAPHRQAGTARAYFQQRQITDLVARPGRQDITRHIDFTEIESAGRAVGLATLFHDSQARFLTGILSAIEVEGKLDPTWMTQRSRAFQTLTHPEHFGRAFRSLVQAKTSS